MNYTNVYSHDVLIRHPPVAHQYPELNRLHLSWACP